ncbi:hypothetical protein [Desulfosarcina variabilis]|uniref:hypothetical protein n=1 Tax=Desulfosarcina variabilis TaxID=2300 RepID=UPI003AFAE160
MGYNRLRHRNTFSDVWAILRQPSTAWITQQLLPHIQGADQKTEYRERTTDKQDVSILKYK